MYIASGFDWKVQNRSKKVKNRSNSVKFNRKRGIISTFSIKFNLFDLLMEKRSKIDQIYSKKDRNQNRRYNFDVKIPIVV